MALVEQMHHGGPGQEPGASPQDCSGWRFKTLGSLAKGRLIPSFGHDTVN